ncbi:MAG: signal transduction histidine kinase/CheY-like chemotaxis protein [Planctomycetota bacterium]|jgi:signal transduction histidine kinase/CheY-like chemotaxis protein
MSPNQDRKNSKSRLHGLKRAVSEKAQDLNEPEGLSDNDSVSGAERQLTRLLEIAKAMNCIRDQDELLVYANDRLRELFDAQNAFVVLFGEDDEPVIHASYIQNSNSGGMPLSRTMIEQVRVSREPMIVDDASNDSGLRDRRSVEELKIASAMCAPLIIDGEVIGILQFDHRGDSHPFSKSDLRLLTLFSDQVATTLSNLRLIRRIEGALSEVKSAQSKVVEAERLSALGEMAGGIAHNFNNTLFVAQGLCESLLAREDVLNGVRSTIERIRTCSLDAASTLRRLTSFSNGQPRVRDEYLVYPAKIAAEIPLLTEHKWKDEAGSRGVEINVVIQPESTPPVNASPTELREILTNLMFNAVDSMTVDGAVTVRTGTSDGRVFFQVEDEGVGMSEAVKRQIYEPFFTTKGDDGTGFGLSTCWSITRGLGGEIDVESVEGEGTKFTVWLPEASGYRAEEEFLAAGDEGDSHILVVDDDPDVRITIVELTKLLGYRVSAFAAGREALEVLSNNKGDLLISDVGMPEMDGNELVRKAKSARPDMPIILVSGWANKVTLKEDVTGLVDSILAKPVSLELLKETIARALRTRSA